MQARAEGDDRPACAIIAGIVDVLAIEGGEEAAMDRDRKVIIGLHNFLGAIGQPPVAQEKTETAQRQIFAMVAGDTVADERNAELIARSAVLSGKTRMPLENRVALPGNPQWRS